MSYPVPHGAPEAYPSPYSSQLLTPPPPRSSTAHVVIAWILAVGTAFYLLPWAIAATRNKRNVVPIALINLFLGWTLAGWIAALVMACLNDDRPTTMVIAHQPVGYAYAPQPYVQQAQAPQPYAPQPYAPQQYVQQPHPQLATPTRNWPRSQPTAAYPAHDDGDEPTRVLENPREF